MAPLISSNAVIILLLIFSFLTVTFSFFSFIISIINVRDISKLSDIPIKLSKIEYIIQQMHTNTQINQVESSYTNMLQQMAGEQPPPVLFKSLDGKHTATSVRELFEKMASDPNSDMSIKDMSALKKFFEQISENIESLDDDDEENDLDEQ